MPLVRICSMQGRPIKFAKEVDEIACRTIIDTLQVPGKDSVQVLLNAIPYLLHTAPATPPPVGTRWSSSKLP